MEISSYFHDILLLFLLRLNAPFEGGKTLENYLSQTLFLPFYIALVQGRWRGSKGIGGKQRLAAIGGGFVFVFFFIMPMLFFSFLFSLAYTRNNSQNMRIKFLIILMAQR